MGERRGTRGLELWCRRMTEGYPGVKIDNMTTSWRDGLAFCAMIHHFRPDLIDFSKLNKDDIHYNNKLAFRIAEDHLGIPALLEPEDMVEYSVPDRLSILTYLSQFYKAFAVQSSNSPTKISPKRPPPSDIQMHMATSTSSPPKKAALQGIGVRREPCTKCSLPVFIAERLNVGKALYHRTCFRCARCNSQLTLANYYETENSEFCCETCPDEERSLKQETDILKRSLSDEEKSASLKGDSDLYSASFENVLENSEDVLLKRNFTLNREINSSFIKARSSFMTTQLITSSSESESGGENDPPPLPNSAVPCLEKDHIERSENSDASSSKPLPSLSDYPSCKFVDQHLPDQTQYESQNLVTKDISASDKANTPSIKSRIKLFEGDGENRLKLTKSDVNREYVKLSDQHDKVPSSNVSVDIRLSPKHSVREDDEVDVLNCSGSDKLTEFDNSTIDSLTEKESYQTDINNTESLIVSDHNESAIVISSDNESIVDLTIESNPKDKFDSSSVILIEDTSEEKSALSPSQVCVSGEDSQLNLDASEENSKSEQYPDDLNPFGDDDIDEERGSSFVDTSKSVSLNPFGDTDDDDEEEQKIVEQKKPEASPRRGRLQKSSKSSQLITRKPVITNPFDSDDDDDNESNETASSLPPQPAERKLLRTPKISLGPILDDPMDVDSKSLNSGKPIFTNPFGSDDDDDDDIDTKETPYSLPPQPAERKLLRAPRISLGHIPDEPMDKLSKPFISGSSAKTAQDNISLTGSGRKKKPAPKPPTATSIFGLDGTDSPMSSIASSPSQSVCHSPKSVRVRKMKRAPLPPTSTPIPSYRSLQVPPQNTNDIPETESKPLQFRIGSEENLKTVKDEMNRNMQYSATSPPSHGPSASPNKSTYGKWKRRKEQAPARPVAQRRSIQTLPVNEIKHELDLIETQQLGLEKQGVKLEKLIRERSEMPGVNTDEALPPEVEDMVLELFDLVNEKNELFRRQTELMYLRRQHRLEVEQADLEYQIRCLMLKPDSTKTDVDKSKEEQLIKSLVEIVERRNEIVDCVEMDRQRKEEEDTSIRTQLSLFSIRREESGTPKKKKSGKKQKHKKEKGKEKKT